MRIARAAETLTAVLRERLEREPDARACVLLHAGCKDEEYSLWEILERAHAFASHLQKSEQSYERLICVCLYHSVDLLTAFIGSILAGQIPTIIAPPSPRMEQGKYTNSIRRLVKHLQPQFVVVDQTSLSEFEASDVNDMFTCSILNIKEIKSLRKDWDKDLKWKMADPKDVAFLQHSSGTTGLQKGVALSHEAVLRQLQSYSRALGLNKEDVIVSWLPLYHDMGLIACFLLPLLSGIPFVQMSPFDWVLHPGRLFEAIHRYNGTLCFLPNFAFDFLSSSVRESSPRDWSLAGMRGFINCSEPVSHWSHARFVERFYKMGARSDQLWASYAMAENVFAVTQSPIGSETRVDVVKRRPFTEQHISLPAGPNDSERGVIKFASSGVVIGGTEVRIVNAEGISCPERVVGEISIRGESLFTGYYHREDLTKEAFTAGGWYRTGDLGYMADGHLFVTGRKKDLIIVQGRNFYPADVEALVSGIEGVVPGRVVAFGLWDYTLGTESMIVLAECLAGDTSTNGRIKLEIRKRISEEFGCTLRDVQLVPPRWLVKSTAGKLARGDNKAKYLRELTNA